MGNRASGLVVANDSNEKRAQLMMHRLATLEMPQLVVTIHKAEFFPDVHAAKDNRRFQYDRVLCDVPCSGDGTLRKAPSGWSKWNVNLHGPLPGLQLKILKRGLHILKVGGRLVYSTCCFNPLENEDVVHRVLLEATATRLSLLEVSPEELRGLDWLPGLSSWRVFNHKEKIWVEKEIDEASSVSQIAMKRCLRVAPHHSNTGGFFIAVFEKHQEMPWEETRL
eukprot:TRINITY_DN125511_c0_g1_i1.p1 TRINITY_DN125511_c0_g1~~TRINITY_DN125511_c0_g1_i1.p1  ORF type:complete len:242 (+),score=12.77 TRINITY_DN125511_c0_g1_i1:58-726(+)